MYWVILISRRQRDMNNDLALYLESRSAKDQDNSGSFFKRVDSIIPRRASSSESVPSLDSLNSTVYNTPKRSWFWFFSFRSKPSLEDEIPEDLPEDMRKELEEVEVDIEELDDEVEQLEERRESLISRFFNLLRGGRRRVTDDEDISEDLVREAMGEESAAAELEKETREVLKLIHKWIGRLSPEEINSFKRSSDFSQYKDLLDRYNLIK